MLVLDEPSNGLDPDGIRWLRPYLTAFAAREGTVFVSSHQIAELAMFATDLVVVGGGKLIAAESVEAMIARNETVVIVDTPQPQELRALLGERHITVESIDGRLHARATTTSELARIAYDNRILVLEVGDTSALPRIIAWSSLQTSAGPKPLVRRQRFILTLRTVDAHRRSRRHANLAGSDGEPESITTGARQCGQPLCRQPEDNVSSTGPEHRADAHRARLARCVDRPCPDERKPAGPFELANEHHLCVGSDVVVRVYEVVSLNHDLVADHEERAERVIAGGACLIGDHDDAAEKVHPDERRPAHRSTLHVARTSAGNCAPGGVKVEFLLKLR